MIQGLLLAGIGTQRLMIPSLNEFRFPLGGGHWFARGDEWQLSTHCNHQTKRF